MRRMIVLAASLMLVTSLSAQLKDLGAKLLKGKDNPVTDMLKKPAPITTGLEDVNMEGSLVETHGANVNYKPMISLERTATGGFMLKEGYYEFGSQSYCLKAGTHGPGGGDGYMFAPPLGPKEDIVVAIIRNSYSNPQIPQRDIQQLLWAIIARTKFEDLQNKLKVVAGLLLTGKQILELQGGVMGIIPDPILQKGIAELPQPVQSVIEAENKLRKMLTSASATYEEMEAVAVLAGVVGIGPGSKAVPMGRWSLHPDGYYVRYLPKGYSYTVVQVWVPNGSPAVGKEYDPSMHIAVPGNTSRQRLIQSGRPYQQ